VLHARGQLSADTTSGGTLDPRSCCRTASGPRSLTLLAGQAGLPPLTHHARRPPRCDMISAVSAASRPSRYAVASRAWTRQPRPEGWQPRGGRGRSRGQDQARSALSRRAISVPLTPVRRGLSRSLAAKLHRRSGCVQGRTVPIPKLIVRVRFSSPAPDS